MRERPILFSAPMIREILADRKTQTRRVVKDQPADADGCERQVAGPVCIDLDPGTHFFRWLLPSGISAGFLCPYGQPGDRLWVRETWRVRDAHLRTVQRRATPDEHGGHHLSHGDAEWWARWGKRSEAGRWQPAIYLPRWASRLTLEVTSVRVERLQEITEDDARAEGVEASNGAAPSGWARHNFADLWESINGPESWEANPFVWVVGFKRVEVRHG